MGDSVLSCSSGSNYFSGYNALLPVVDSTNTLLSNDALRAVIESLPDAILVVTLDRRILLVNQAFELLWGLLPNWSHASEPLYQIDTILYQMKDKDEFVRKVTSIWAHPEAKSSNLFELLDRRLIECYTRPYHINGQLVGQIWSFRDVTVREHAEIEFRVLKYVAETLNESLTPDRALRNGLNMLAFQLRAEAAWLWTFNEAGLIELSASYNQPACLDHDISPQEGWPLCECLQCLLQGKISSMTTIMKCQRLIQAGLSVCGLTHHISVPICNAGQPIGLINIVVHPDQTLGEADVRLLNAVSDQFGVAIERARLFAVERAHREKAEALNEIAQAISSTLDLNTMLRTVVRLTVGLLNAEGGSFGLLTPDGQGLELRYAMNLPMPMLRDTMPRGVGAAWQAIEQGQTIIIDDYADFMHTYLPALRAGVRRVMSTPVVAGEGLLGALSIYHINSERLFSPHDRTLIEAVARQAGVAIQNERRYETERQRVRELEALRTTMADISAQLEFPHLLQMIITRSLKLLRGVSSELALYDEAHNNLVIVGSKNLDQDYSGIRHEFGEGLIGYVAATRRPLIVGDYQTWAGRSFQYESFTDPQTVLAVPLLAGDQLIGVITVGAHYATRTFSNTDVQLLELLAQQATIAIQNARLFAETQHLAQTDPLTGLLNRRHFFTLARREVERAHRHTYPLSVIMLDVDHFKRINDTFGHTVGDQVLRVIADRCRTQLRQIDIIGRYGGEEFIVLLPDTALEDAQQAALRLCHFNADTPVPTSLGPVSITISLGLAALSHDFNDLDQLLSAADQALYQAKQSGRNRLVIAELHLFNAQ